MKKIKIMRLNNRFILLLFMGLSFSILGCKRTHDKAKKEVKNIVNKTKEAISNDKEYVDLKMAHGRALVEIEQAKVHFILENDRLKAKADLLKAKNELSEIENRVDNDFHKSVIETKSAIDDVIKDMDEMKNSAKDKLHNIKVRLEETIDKVDGKISDDEQSHFDVFKRHYAEQRAQDCLLEAKLAASDNTYGKAEKELENATKWYEMAKNEATIKDIKRIENLQGAIQKAKKSLQNKEESAIDEIDVLIIDFE